MNSDIRISTSLLRHPKTIKLRRRLGADGVLALIDLWCWAAQYRPGGLLHDMTEEDIELAAQWNNDSLTDRSTFVATLLELRWLDVDKGVYSLHDWVDHNGYASCANDRSDKSRFSRMAKTHPAIYKELKAKGVTAISAEEYKRATTAQRPLNESLNTSSTERISPSPLPSPSFKTEEEEQEGAGAKSNKPKRPPGYIRTGGSIALFVKAFRRQPNGFEQPVLADWELAYPEGELEHAFREAGERGAANLKYVEKVLEEHHGNGTGTGRGKRKTAGKAQRSPQRTGSNSEKNGLKGARRDWAGDMPAVGG